MPRFLVLLLALLWHPLCAQNAWQEASPELISARIVDLIDIDAPVILDIQAGDLTSQLDVRVRQLLLAKGADLREPSLAGQDSYQSENPDSLNIPRLDLLALREANLVQVTMELGGTTVERKNFLSFQSVRYPLYTFQVRQLALPGYRLKRVDSLSFTDQTRKSEGPALTGIKWFEPALAATALASLIYLLWTTE